MTDLTTTGKRLLPRPVKEGLRGAIRQYGVVTATSRPLPDFLVLGTKRGGTTSMWNYLLGHPGVLAMFPPAENFKSPHYFYWHYDRGERWYRSHFATERQRRRSSGRTGQPVAAGEASPYYLYDPRVPARVRALMPDVRLVVMLRDPVERAYSHYKERVRAGVEDLSFEEALDAEPARLAGELERMMTEPGYYSRSHDWYSYRDRGIYLPQLQRWSEQFPAEQLLVLRSEDFYLDPAAQYDRVVSFLGLAPFALQGAERWNYRPAAGMSDSTRQELEEFYAPHNAALEDYLGRPLGWASAQTGSDPDAPGQGHV
ncbi:MAG: sulfotransferase [Angustibacter sp.]